MVILMSEPILKEKYFYKPAPELKTVVSDSPCYVEHKTIFKNIFRTRQQI
eukprot:TRINITY_DN8564_c0_g1_i1.p1 TRINITY_DN8564_c0_g1~~TRINITY_DN8564_c0_g1_i1.p1  ORF type:complete len:50 (+),score=5.66 TRINITY_DN8564_c0_g1_i1:295-444(+)